MLEAGVVVVESEPEPELLGLQGVAPAESLAVVVVMPRTTVGSVVMIPMLRSSFVLDVT